MTTSSRLASGTLFIDGADRAAPSANISPIDSGIHLGFRARQCRTRGAMAAARAATPALRATPSANSALLWRAAGDLIEELVYECQPALGRPVLARTALDSLARSQIRSTSFATTPTI